MWCPHDGNVSVCLGEERLTQAKASHRLVLMQPDKINTPVVPSTHPLGHFKSDTSCGFLLSRLLLFVSVRCKSSAMGEGTCKIRAAGSLTVLLRRSFLLCSCAFVWSEPVEHKSNPRNGAEAGADRFIIKHFSGFVKIQHSTGCEDNLVIVVWKS